MNRNKALRGRRTEDAQCRAILSRDLDGPADAVVEEAWLVESQRRYRELVDGSVKGVPGHLRCLVGIRGPGLGLEFVKQSSA